MKKTDMNTLQMINHDLDYISHAGVPGMSWRTHKFGKWQNHAVYAQGMTNPDAKKSMSKTEFNSHVNRLVDELNKQCTYGVIDNGKKFDTSENDYDWSKYRTMPVETLKKTKTGVCWDFVNYQHAVLNEKGIPNKSYFIVSRYGNHPDDIKTHTFTIAENNGKLYWIESAWWPERGVHEIKSPSDVAKKAAIFNGKEKPYDLYEFNPDGLDKGLTGGEFFDRASQNLIETTSDKRMK